MYCNLKRSEARTEQTVQVVVLDELVLRRLGVANRANMPPIQALADARLARIVTCIAQQPRIKHALPHWHWADRSWSCRRL